MTRRTCARSLTVGFLLALTPSASWACACGCGVFEMGALPSMTPGTTLFLEYDFMDQNRNWSGTSGAPASANDDKDIKTDFFTLGGQYLFDQDWSVKLEAPYWNRAFTTDTGAGIATFRHSALGDIRLTGIYTGLSDDMTTGVIFGVKLPTGDFRTAGFDRDTEIGTGSTDALLGLYHAGTLTRDESWGWYGQIMWDKPLAAQSGYTPGGEFDGAVGITYSGFKLGDGVRITPVLQMIGSSRASDGGIEADPPNTGYNRVLLSPGVEVDYRGWQLYGDVEFPVYQDMNGNQLVANRLFKFIASYSLDG